MDTITRQRIDELASPRRNHFFYGKLLDEMHLRMEQDYFNGKRWMLNRLALGRGVLCGLQVSVDGKHVWVSPGVALDAYGREIVVPQQVRVDPAQIAVDCGTTRDRKPEETKLYLALCYHACRTDFVPALVTDCKPQDQCAPSTIVESYCIEVRVGEPPAVTHDQALCDALADGKDAEGKRNALCELLTKSPYATVSGDACVVLATLKIAAADGTVGDIHCCTARDRVYNNAQLFDMLLCGQRGDESDPTRIIAVSWVHAQAMIDDPLVNLALTTTTASEEVTSTYGKALVIGFSRKVHTPGLQLPLFEVMMRQDAPMTDLYAWYGLRGAILPITSFDQDPGTRRITGASLELAQDANGNTMLPAQCTGLAFYLEEGVIPLLRNADIALVRLRGDFVVDVGVGARSDRAIDAEFARAQFPSGDGAEGGTFESWFMRTGRSPTQAGQNLTGSHVSLNRASTLELALVPGISLAVAQAIIAARDRKRGKRFRSLNELKGVDGIDSRLLNVVKPNIKLD